MTKKIQLPAFEKHFQDFQNLIKAKDPKASHTTYTTPIKEFLIWLERFGIDSIRNVDSKDLQTYSEYLAERPNQRREGTLSSTTIKTHLLALSMFLEHLLTSREIQRGFTIPPFKGNDRKERSVLTVDEIRLLYQYSENLLEEALLSVGYGCGLRRSELQDLNLSDVQLSTGMLIVRKGKNNKRREVPMSDKVLTAVKRYVWEYRTQFLAKTQETAFFLNAVGKRMSGEHLNTTLKRIIERSQNQIIIEKEITLHCLRHSIAHHLMENNAGIDFIRDFLGHSFINTAHLYAKKNNTRTKTRYLMSHEEQTDH
ncbi:tyrosine-type recombinase/integrase [Flavobacterium silvaticum]|uniref:Tyrosine-type recombinase/integrase n=1 Tax=Flavobacterium silvaticum TaxID=1852020 RepID=A0A972JG65_9FLAO|nr:tyrosine-type recombinase/integrase [Flavobacterium silvaticum]NMH26535.1 tyrosine-type recombinase/integrase [Flavobacterium silvaticum]